MQWNEREWDATEVFDKKFLELISHEKFDF